MDFEDLMCDTANEVENGIYEIAECFGEDIDDTFKDAFDIRENLTIHFHGCLPYHDGDEDTPCYSVGCDYGCIHCPMKNFEAIGEYNPKSDKVSDKVTALIKAIKMDANYEPTETEIKEAIDIIRR